MRNINGIYYPQPDPTDYIPKDKRMGHMSTRTVRQLAEGATCEQFQRMCDSGLSTVDDLGRDIHGRQLYEEFSMYCREDNE